jgi:hypothetical protein
MRSSSRASFSASGISGIVSKDEILGLRERKLVGVEGMETEETEEAEFTGYDSLYLEPSTGEECKEGEPPGD